VGYGEVLVDKGDLILTVLFYVVTVFIWVYLVLCLF